MGLYKNLRKSLIKNSLQKKEDPEAYKKLAQTGFILAHPVKIAGKNKRPDNGIDYHSTIKFFDKEGKKLGEFGSYMNQAEFEKKMLSFFENK